MTGMVVAAWYTNRPGTLASRMWVTRPVRTPLEVYDLVQMALAARLDPAAFELDLPAGAGPRPWQGSRAEPMACHPSTTAHATTGPAQAGTLGVVLEGGPADVAERVDRVVALFGGASVSPVPPQWWRRHPFGPGDTALRLEVPITDLHAAVYALRDAAGGPVAVRGSAGLGVVHAALPGSMATQRVAAVLAAVRGVLLARHGRCVVLSAPEPVRREVGRWSEPVRRRSAGFVAEDQDRDIVPRRLGGETECGRAQPRGHDVRRIAG